MVKAKTKAKKKPLSNGRQLSLHSTLLFNFAHSLSLSLISLNFLISFRPTFGFSISSFLIVVVIFSLFHSLFVGWKISWEGERGREIELLCFVCLFLCSFDVLVIFTWFPFGIFTHWKFENWGLWVMEAPKPEEISHPPMDQLQGLEYCIDSNPSWGNALFSVIQRIKLVH